MVKKYSECIAKNAGTGDCTTYKQGRFCYRHQGQFYRGIIDAAGIRLRDSYPREKIDDCFAKNKNVGPCYGRRVWRFCSRHVALFRKGVIDNKGDKIENYSPATRSLTDFLSEVQKEGPTKGRYRADPPEITNEKRRASRARKKLGTSYNDSILTICTSEQNSA